MHILIVKLSAIGDVIHTLPALNVLREHYPDAHITWLVEEIAAPLVIGHPALDRILISRRKHWLRGLRKPGRKKVLAEIIRFIHTLRDTRYDIIIDFQALLKSGVLIALAKGKRKIGFDRGMQHDECSYIFLNERIPPVSMEHHALTRYLMLVNSLGVPTGNDPTGTGNIQYNLPVSARDRKVAVDLLWKNGIDIKNRIPNSSLAAMNPVAKWGTKLWSEDCFARLADRLIADGCDVVFTGGPGDTSIIQDIMERMKYKSRAGNLAGKTTLMTLAAIYEKMDFLITTDTGPMHLAAAVGLSVIALFGPTAPWRTGPYGKGHRVLKAELSCSPCFKRHCETKECMHSIRVEDVIEASRKLYRHND